MAMRVAKGWGRTKPPPGTSIDLAHPLGRMAAAWPMSEGGGKKTKNVVGGWESSLLSAATWGKGQFGGSAVVLDGDTDAIDMPYVSISSSSDWTLSLWFWSDVNIASGNRLLWGGNPADGVTFVGTLTTNTAISVRGDSNWLLTFNVPAMAQSRWYHLVVTKYAGYVNVYLNGVVSTSGAQADYGGLTLYQIGGYGFTPALNWLGKLDNARIYRFALTESQAKQLYSDPWAGYYAPRRKLISPIPAAPSADLLLPSRIGYSRFVSR